MDQINSTPHFSYAKLYQQLNGPESKPSPAARETQLSQVAQIPPPKAPSASDSFSSMFADDELAKLQQNLEAISTLAEKALKKIEN